MNVLTGLFIIAFLISPATATNFTMSNRSINLSNNINYVVNLESSTIPLSAAQVTFNYDPTALHVNWVKQGNFLYYASDDAKIWNVWDDKLGKIMVVSMELFDRAVMQSNKSTLMTINMKPLRKGITPVNLTHGVLVGEDESKIIVDGMNKNYTIKVT